MTLLLLTLAAFALTMLALALGALLTGRRLKGSCGGIASGEDCICERAGIDPTRCPRKDSSLEPGSGAPSVIAPSRLRRR